MFADWDHESTHTLVGRRVVHGCFVRGVLRCEGIAEYLSRCVAIEWRQTFVLTIHATSVYEGVQAVGCDGEIEELLQTTFDSSLSTHFSVSSRNVSTSISYRMIGIGRRFQFFGWWNRTCAATGDINRRLVAASYSGRNSNALFTATRSTYLNTNLIAAGGSCESRCS